MGEGAEISTDADRVLHSGLKIISRRQFGCSTQIWINSLNLEYPLSDGPSEWKPP